MKFYDARSHEHRLNIKDVNLISFLHTGNILETGKKLEC
jgi:hypothetical protein